jgi:hypothetical protein
MDRVGPGSLRGLEERVHAQVALGSRWGTEKIRLIGQLDMEGLAVGLGVDGYGAKSEVANRPHDANGDLPTIGDEDFAEHGGL